MTLYKNKYRVESARLKGWDYRSEGMYFITICTKGRVNYFGACTNGQMKLNAAGEIANQFWKEIPEHFNHVALGEFIVMPNHLHGVLILKNLPERVVAVETLHCNVSTATTTMTTTAANTSSNHPNGKNEFMSAISPKPGSVGTIVRSFKSACTKQINLLYPQLHFQWQERFHDHIIRSGAEFHRISNYIINNPTNWMADKFYQAKNPG